MEIYERLNELIKHFAQNSQAQFARSLGVLPTTFNGYMSKTGQEKIRFSLFEDILKAYPTVSRDWLLFGEGEMLAGESLEASAENVTALQKKVEELEQELREADRLNRTLMTRLLIDGEGDKHDVPGIGEAVNGQR